MRAAPDLVTIASLLLGSGLSKRNKDHMNESIFLFDLLFLFGILYFLGGSLLSE